MSISSKVPKTSLTVNRGRLVKTKNRLNIVKYFSFFLSDDSFVFFDEHSFNKENELEHFYILNKGNIVTTNDYQLFQNIKILDTRVFFTKNVKDPDNTLTMMKVQFLI